MDSVDIGDDPAPRNDGLMKHRSIASRSREFDMIGRLHADIFFQDPYCKPVDEDLRVDCRR